ncbi:MAG TPA: patatin-like phospholipase family protein [Alcanivoracaceae bacterium]|nr:patatin-like phospholipase family protein [Alcanivoracaceae bacterium]
MAKALRVMAGPTAYAHIKQNGLSPHHISAMVGASGGPKWLSLAKLDEYIFGEYFSAREKPLHIVGSSAGAWRFACFAHPNPAKASADFAHAYQHICYHKDMTTAEITEHSMGLLDVIYPDEATSTAAATNPHIKLHVVASRAKNLSSLNNRAAQTVGLVGAAVANGISRRWLGYFFERVVFHPEGEPGPFTQWPVLPTQTVSLTPQNIRKAITASGSIPLVLEGVPNIPDAAPGMYYDGGVTDYHFDIPFAEEGIVLYPHFYPAITPGWFDKSITWRKPRPENFDNVVMLCPTDEWLASLPQGRIPDRHDFINMDDNKRIAAWGDTMARSAELVEDFQRFSAGDHSALELVTQWR